MDIKSGIAGGLKWQVEHWKQGILVETIPITSNLTPQEMLALNAAVLFDGAPMPSAWYVGIYETDYTPTSTVTAATINALATECTAYAEATREPFVHASTGVGAVSNEASPAEFTMSATKNIYGGFLSSQPTKGSTSGVLLSVVKFPTVKNVDSTSILRVKAFFASFSV